MIEYPRLIIKVESSHTTRSRLTGETINFGWDLRNVAEGSYQVRIMHDDDDSVIQNRNIGLKAIFSEGSLTTTQGNFYSSAVEGYLQVADVLPDAESLKMILRVFIFSNPFYMDDSDLDFCEEEDCLAPMPLHEDGEHTPCQVCGKWQPELMMEAYYIVGGADEETLHICNDCNISGYTITDVDGIEQCVLCSEYCRDTIVRWTQVLGHGQVLACIDCLDVYYQCVDCGTYAELDDLMQDEEDEFYCDACFPDDNSKLVEDWNYLPDLIFHPTLPTNPLKPLYIGMEIEINWYDWRRDDAAKDWLQGIKDDHEDIMFVKGDSSVNDGFELVTHPMSPEWALENFPFKELEYAVDAGASQKHKSTGIHIHIDRGALTTAQLWKILKVHEKQRELCGIIGGRGTNSEYASWDNNYDCVGERAMEIARAKGKAWGGSDRYVPINLKNENTIELRYMEGSIAVPDLKKNIEWVQALYDFTDHISVEDVKKGVLDVPGFLLGWIVDQEKIYPNLTGFVLARTMIPLEMPERSNACA